MAGSNETSRDPFRLGEWRVEPQRLLVSHPDLEDVHLTRRAMSVLCTLAAANGQVVAKYAVMDAVWGQADVSDGVLSQTILELRTAFRDEARSPRMIETIRGVGLRLIPTVEPLESASARADSVRVAGAEALARRSTKGTLAGIMGGVALVAILAWAYLETRGEPPAIDGAPRIMVAPFADLSPDGGYDYFAAGMADDIALHLAGSPQITLVANRTVLALGGVGLAPDQIADRLDADLLLTGSVQRREDSIRLVARLTDTRAGEELWITSLTRPVEDVFAMQDEAARSIASIVLRGEELPLRAAPTQSLAAYDLYLRGRDAQKQFTAASTAAAKRLFEQALEEDPSFALARARLAECWANEGYIFEQGADALQRALLEAELALGAEPSLPEGLHARSLALVGLGRFAEARTRIAAAVERAPNDIDILFLSGFLADTRGEAAAAVRDYGRALEVDPLLPRTVALGRVHFLLGDADVAVRVAERGPLRGPGYPSLYLAHLMTLMGRHEEAETLCSEVLQLNLPRSRNLCGFSALVGGRSEEARQLLDEDWSQEHRAQWGPFSFTPSATHLALLQDDEATAAQLLAQSEEVTRAAIAAGNDHWALRYTLAVIAAQRGEPEIALDWLDEAYEEGFRDWALLAIDPALAPIRDSDGVASVVERIEKDLGISAATP